MKQGRVRIGISGWRYRPWRGVFYPDDLPQRRELSYAASKFSSVEINGTFYSLQRPESFAGWADAVPDDFQFAVKGPRFITHMLRLTRAQAPLANFFASGVLRLGKKLGPVLWQLPPQTRFDPERLEAFFRLLPRSTAEAAKLAKKHDTRMRGRSWLKTDADRPVRHALEIRHETFRTPQFSRLLRRHNIALVCADTVEWPLLFDVTADFCYLRLHGSEQLYASGYDAAAIRAWASRIAAWTRGREPKGGERASTAKPKPRATRDVYVYFDNDAKVRAPFDALALMKRLNRLGIRV